MFNFFKKKEKEPKIFLNPSCVRDCPRSNKCPNWLILYRQSKNKKGEIQSVKEEGCAIKWIPIILVEIKDEIRKLNGNKSK